MTLDAVRDAACVSGDRFDSGALQIRKCGCCSADAHENLAVDFPCPESSAAGHTALAPFSGHESVLAHSRELREYEYENNEE